MKRRAATSATAGPHNREYRAADTPGPPSIFNRMRLILDVFIAISTLVLTAPVFLILSVIFIVIPPAQSKNIGKNIFTPPGFFVLLVAEFLCTKKIYERVFLLNVLDMREEYFEALSASRKGKALWVVVRGYFALGMTVILQIGVGSMVKIVKTFWG